MAVLTDLLESGNLKPVIDRTYPLKSIPEALAYLMSGHTRGKAIIAVA
jgi:NADPH:quinone reductase-like Zn-dependent oxidoreductase